MTLAPEETVAARLEYPPAGAGNDLWGKRSERGRGWLRELRMLCRLYALWMLRRSCPSSSSDTVLRNARTTRSCPGKKNKHTLGQGHQSRVTNNEGQGQMPARTVCINNQASTKHHARSCSYYT